MQYFSALFLSRLLSQVWYYFVTVQLEIQYEAFEQHFMTSFDFITQVTSILYRSWNTLQ